MKLYKDAFYYCENYNPSATILTKTDCFNQGGDWIKFPLNAENIGSGILYLFLVSAT